MRALPAPYEVSTAGRTMLVSLPRATDAMRRALDESGTLFAYASRHPGATRMQGRGPLYSVPADAERWVVRHYWRGGAMARWLVDRYLEVGEPRPLRELRASRAVRARGIATPEVVAVAVYPAGRYYRADLVTVEVPSARNLVQALFGERAITDGARLRAWRAAGRLVRTLEARGVAHMDLNLKNIVLARASDGPRPYLVDLDRCRVVDRLAWWQRLVMRRRFRRSLAKWEASARRGVGPEEREAFDCGYRTIDG